jgi:hypothetical protein
MVVDAVRKESGNAMKEIVLEGRVNEWFGESRWTGNGD